MCCGMNNGLHIAIDIGVEKLNDNTKKNYFRKSNRHKPASDMLKIQYKANSLKCHARIKRAYT